ncbi:MAG: sulfurtransferase TusA family protein [bacterium]
MSEFKIDKEVDLTGVACPINYVKTKLALEALAAGQILAILLDDGEPIVNVPRSAKEDGHKILEVNKINDSYQVLIRRGEEQ